MKISLRWVFDHIVGKCDTLDIADLMNRFIKTTAEVEAWRKVSCNVDVMTLVELISVDADCITVRSLEHKKEYALPARPDVVIGLWYLIENNGTHCFWATAITVGGMKDLLLPAIEIEASLRAGGWKKQIELDDYSIEIDNKSINHRPDLWGHRGIAREFAAILHLSTVSLDTLLVEKNIKDYAPCTAAQVGDYGITIQDSHACDRFAALSLNSIQNRPSSLFMVIRLSRIDSRAIDFLIDSTNYVMFDLGQPMHAFDAHTLAGKQLTVRKAHAKEKLLLLDGEVLTLTDNDIVVADGEKAVSLAGIMGGATTGITAHTQSVVLESAHFDPTIIRKMSLRHKKRTESSMRFEKNLDPFQNVTAIKRFLFLLDLCAVPYSASGEISSLGIVASPVHIALHHSFIEKRLGISVDSEHIVTILTQLSFGVEKNKEDDDLLYIVTVPAWRATKDVKIAEDIVEEIGRFIGYDNIVQLLPSMRLKASDLRQVYRVRAIKRFLSYGCSMRELCGYAFFDEQFLRTVSWEPIDSVSVKNPVSEIHSRLVTTLQPHMLKAVSENGIHHKQLRFYEWGRTWHCTNDGIAEKKVLTGVMYDHEKKIDFYDGKALLMRLFSMLGLQDISWQQSTQKNYTWLVENQTAIIMHNDIRIGMLGVVDEYVSQSFITSGSILLFELDGDCLLTVMPSQKRFLSLPKYPSVFRDVSMLMPVSATIDRLAQSIKMIDSRVEHVTLIDFFSKPEWKDQKSVAFHVELRDATKTLEHENVEEIWKKVIDRLIQQGAIIR